jgi:hypothetical protein
MLASTVITSIFRFSFPLIIQHLYLLLRLFNVSCAPTSDPGFTPHSHKRKQHGRRLSPDKLNGDCHHVNDAGVMSLPLFECICYAILQAQLVAAAKEILLTDFSEHTTGNAHAIVDDLSSDPQE